MTPRPKFERTGRTGGSDNTRRPNDLATLREVAAIVTEGNRRQKEYLDGLFDSFVMEYEYRESQKLGAKIKRFFTLKRGKHGPQAKLEDQAALHSRQPEDAVRSIDSGDSVRHAAQEAGHLQELPARAQGGS